MTLKAPFHLQRRGLRNDRHLIDAAVAGRATDALIHMDRVIEIREVGKVMDSNPLKRLAGFETYADRLEISAVSPNLFVAVHADGRGRHACGRCCLN